MTIAEAPPLVAAAADASLRWHPGAAYRLDQTLFPLQRGNGDPSFAVHPSGFWLAFTTASGPATLRLSAGGLGTDSFVDAQAWGPGAEAAIAGVPRLLGAGDDWSAFDEPAFHSTLPRLVTESRRRNLAVRLPSTGRAHHPRTKGHHLGGPTRLQVFDVPLRNQSPRSRGPARPACSTHCAAMVGRAFVGMAQSGSRPAAFGNRDAGAAVRRRT